MMAGRDILIIVVTKISRNLIMKFYDVIEINYLKMIKIS